MTRWFLLSWVAAALHLSWALCGWATYALKNKKGKVGRGEQWWNSASCRRIGLKENCIDMNKIGSLICLIVSFIKHTIRSSREFCLQGSVTNMTLHLSYYYCGGYLCFTASWLLDLFFFSPQLHILENWWYIQWYSRTLTVARGALLKTHFRYLDYF